MSLDVTALADQVALRRTAVVYALGADRRDKALWRQALSEDCVIEGPGFQLEGLEANLGSIDMLGVMFRRTLHRVHQVVAEVSGDGAEGETYSTADHLLKEGDAILVWSIRYLDNWRREAGLWRFARRKLIVEWEETRPVTVRESAA